MPKVTYVAADGAATEVEIPVGWSVMEGAIQNDVEGITAECGGGCACATCHVFVDEIWMESFPEKESDEEELLEILDYFQPNSRLSCPLRIQEAHDGLCLKLAPEE